MIGISWWGLLAASPLFAQGYTFKKQLRGHRDWVSCLTFSSDGQTLASGSADRSVRVWNLADGKNIATLEGHDVSLCAVAFHPNSKLLASADFYETIRLWDLASGKCVATLKGKASEEDGGSGGFCLAFSPDGKMLAWGNQHSLKFWDVASRKWIHPPLVFPKPVHALALRADFKMVAICLSDGGLELQELASGKRMRLRDSQAAWTSVLQFSPDGRVLVSATWTVFRDLTRWPNELTSVVTLKLWEVASGKNLGTIEVRDGTVGALALSPDGRTLASALRLGKVRLWDSEKGKALEALPGPNERIVSLAIGPKGKTLAAGNERGVITLWENR
jgi:WD40 repeat protein